MPEENCHSVTLKGREQGSPWLVFKGEDIETLIHEIENAFPGIEGDTLPELSMQANLQWRALEAATMGLHATPAPPAAPLSQPVMTTGDPHATPGQAAPACIHGMRSYKSGGSGNRMWAAYMCPARKDDPSKCKPLDAKTGKEWK